MRVLGQVLSEFMGEVKMKVLQGISFVLESPICIFTLE